MGREIFMQFDLSNDGRLERTELNSVAHYLHKHAGGEWSPDECAKKFEDMDLDHNGTINFREFATFMEGVHKEHILDGAQFAKMAEELLQEASEARQALED